MSAKGAIQRKLDLTSQNFNISKDAPFRQSNQVLDDALKHNKAEGHEKPVEHKAPISDEDWEKLEHILLFAGGFLLMPSMPTHCYESNYVLGRVNLTTS